MITKVKHFIITFADRFAECHTLTFAASVAFYTCFSLAPLIMISLTLIANIGLELQHAFMDEIQALVGPMAADAIRVVIESSRGRGAMVSLTGILGTLTLILSSGLIFGEMRTALNQIFQQMTPAEDLSLFRATLEFVKSRLLHTGLAFGFIFAMLVSLLISTALNTILRTGILPLGRTAVFLHLVFSVGIYILLFTGIFHFLPTPHRPLTDSLWAGLLTALLFVLGKEVVGFYLSRSILSTSYGAAGSIVVLLAWVYYSSMIVFIGGHAVHVWRKEFPHDSPTK